jgi:hypothetical protein
MRKNGGISALMRPITLSASQQYDQSTGQTGRGKKEKKLKKIESE